MTPLLKPRCVNESSVAATSPASVSPQRLIAAPRAFQNLAGYITTRFVLFLSWSEALHTPFQSDLHVRKSAGVKSVCNRSFHRRGGRRRGFLGARDLRRVAAQAVSRFEMHPTHFCLHVLVFRFRKTRPLRNGSKPGTLRGRKCPWNEGDGRMRAQKSPGGAGASSCWSAERSVPRDDPDHPNGN